VFCVYLGKTLAFGIPAIMHVLKKNKKIGGGSKKVNPTCLVLSPTRELAVQVYILFLVHYDYNVKMKTYGQVS